MGKTIETHLLANKCRLQSAPPEQQSMNGLCERNWRSLLRMSRSWLASGLLPANFWWVALKRATDISNYLPIRINGTLTSPHELMYNSKPDYRNLFPMFSVAYTAYSSQHSYNAQTVKTILVGKSEKSNALLFYHPATKQLITSTRYKIDETLCPGPAFGLEYEGGLYFNKYCQNSEVYKPPLFPPQSTVFLNQDGSVKTAEIIAVPINDDLYTLQYEDGSIHQHSESELSPTDPTITPPMNDPRLKTFPKWIKHNTKASLFLNSMTKPKHGYLIHNDREWQFRPGHKLSNKPINLPDFESEVHKLIQSYQLHRGHPAFRKIMHSKSSFSLSQIVAKHVSAAGLDSLDAPTLTKHHKMSKNDKRIWDAAYAEEYNGLQNLPAWTTITESQYKHLPSNTKSLLPTMAISTVKYDEKGAPKRAKYRIVVLGNLDPHQWSKTDCFAPVMSMMEVRLLTAMAVHFCKTLKSGDFKQAFCQATLPKGEDYVLKPPPGCPLTPQGTYWKLQRTLYGLKRSPRHWFDKACSIFKTLGLTQCANAPCLFHGNIIPGNTSKLYVGLYVDDFIYFSTDPNVEKAFEEKLSKLTTVDFLGQATHFLGIRFQWRCTKGRVQAHLSQEAFADNLIQSAGLHQESVSANITPYRSGCPVDSLPYKNNNTPRQQAKLESELRHYVGSLLWLSQGTRPDLATITNILAMHQSNPSKRHIESAKYAIKYVKGTKNHGICFDSFENLRLLAYLNFPLPSTKITGISDANWGPQDQSVPKPYTKLQEYPLFTTRSISGHIICLHGPLHWMSKRQKITARSSGEAEIYATDMCVRDIQMLRNIISDLELENVFFDTRTKVYNDNMACIHWSKKTTTKGLRYIQIKENAIRELAHLFDVTHIQGSKNPADLLSKEDKDVKHFTTFRDALVPPAFARQ